MEEGKGEIPPDLLPQSVLDKVRETRKPLLLENAFKRGDYTEDPVIKENKIRSIFCSPVISDNQLLSLVYFEHNGKFRYFDEEKQEFLELILKQAATAFENSLLYDNLEKKIQRRTDTIRLMNKELENSIHYAKRLQQAILPSLELLGQQLSDSFVLFRPKDIVSGDFYWLGCQEDHLVLAAVDCTGHGVPGAFMTVLGYSSMNSIILDGNNSDPGEILKALDLQVRNALGQDREESTQQDGMDMALCVYHPSTATLTFAGAHNPLYRIRDGELEEFKADKLPIGGGGYGVKEFQTQTIPVQAGDCYYIFSDGYTDQFGGPGERKKRFGKKGLKRELLAIYQDPMQNQLQHLEEVYERHRGDEEQLDDVLIMGFKI
jgi:serine phosphatase RsbU (regulator of sigma subunit)